VSHRVACSTISSLLSDFGLGYSFRDGAVTLVDSSQDPHVVVRVEELGSHHHLLLLSIRIRIRSFSLIY